MLDRVAIALRPRGGFEAIDLGARMLQAWWRPIYAAWFAVYLPVAVAVHGALWEHPLAACFTLWWLKPLFDRFVLHVVSRSVFGDTPSLAATLRDWRPILGTGLVATLTWRRPFDFARSFTLPAFQLEGQRGAPGRARRRQLGRRLRGHAVGLTLACCGFLFVLWLAASFIGFEMLSVRGPSDGSVSSPADLFLGDSWWSLSDNVAYIVAESLVEPFFVCAGFALYLSRRVMLEGWDVELGLRRMTQRLAQRRAGTGAPRGALAAMLMLVVLGAACGHDRAHAGPADATGPAALEAEVPSDALKQTKSGSPRATKAREAIVAVLADPVFGSYLDARRWHARIGETQPRGDPSLIEKLGKLLASVLQGLSWVALGGLVLVLVWAIARRWSGRGDADAGDAAAPTRLFGLAIAPDSLPDDVAAAALALLEQGRMREALSLVYRGALSGLVHRHGLRVPAGDTEGDVVVKAGRLLAGPATEYLRELVRVWIAVAYAGRLPELEAARALCRDYARHFAAPAPEPGAAVPAGAGA